MPWFQRFFPAFMVLFPLVFTLCAGRHAERAHDDVPQRMRRLWFVSLVALMLHVGMQWWVESEPSGLKLLRAAWPSGFSVGAFMIIWFGFASPALQARQPGWRRMPHPGSPELAEAWASLRRFKAWCFFGLGLIGTTGFAAVALVTVFAPDVAGMSGTVLGTVAGITGGVFGTLASVRRARINALLQELGGREANSPEHTT